MYMFAIGVVELVCVSLIAFESQCVSARLATQATWVLLAILLKALYFHYMGGGRLQGTGGTIMVVVIVFIRLYTRLPDSP